MKETSNVRKIAFVGDHLPRKCGIATFTTDLCDALHAEYRETELLALPVNDTAKGYRYPARVRWRTTISRTPTSSRRSMSAVLYWVSARSRVGIARSVIARSRPDVRRADVLARLDSRTG